MKNLVIISFLLLAVSSCIKVTDGEIECAPVAKPQLSQAEYDGSIGSYTSVYINNYSSSLRYTVTRPNGTTFSVTSASFSISVTSATLAGTYYIEARDLNGLCISEKGTFKLNIVVTMPTCTVSENYFRLSSSLNYSTTTAAGQAFSGYYVSSWAPNSGDLDIYFAQLPPKDGDVHIYEVSTAGQTGLSNNQCKIDYQNTAGNIYEGSSGNVYVQYSAGKFAVKFCDVVIRNVATSYTYTSVRGKLYFTE